MSEKGHPKVCPQGGALTVVWDHFPLKMHAKINAKIDGEKNMKNQENQPKTRSKIRYLVFWFFRLFSVKVDFAESSFLLRLNVGLAKSSDPKMNENSLKKHAKNMLEKVMRKTWEFHEKRSQKESKNPLKNH